MLKTPVSFVDVIAEIYGPLLSGLPVVIAGKQEAADPAALGALLDRQAVTVAGAVPAQWRLLANAAGQLPGLRVLTSSGEPLTGRDVALIRRLSPVGRLLNLYGCSEAGADSAVAEITGTGGGPGSLGIGSVIDGAWAVLQIRREPLPAAGRR